MNLGNGERPNRGEFRWRS